MIMSERLYMVRKNGLVGYVDKDGNVEIAPSFSGGFPFSEEMAVVTPDGEKFGVINRWGDLVLNASFHQLGSGFSDGLLAASEDGENYGYVDKEGNMIIDPRFEEACDFREERACIKLDDRFAFVDRIGKLICEPYNEAVSFFSEGLARIVVEGCLGFIDKHGEVRINPQFSPRSRANFGFGLAVTWLPGQLKGAIDLDGNWVVPPVYASLSPMSGGLMRFRRESNGLTGYLRRDGTVAIEARFDDCTDFCEGVACVRMGDMWSIIDANETVIGEFSAVFAGKFSSGCAIVEYDDKIGFVNRYGDFVVPPIFDYAEDFEGDLAKVEKGVMSGYVNSDGRTVWLEE